MEKNQNHLDSPRLAFDIPREGLPIAPSFANAIE